ncbi:hypothetical protein F4861DRAFT_164792 [Xylaria intraflava]|nr:hypothetical protein F4861DRAFT_164792 [Xylaria intraflava]
MTDADYFLDLSSPDPLADGIPSSVRPSTRRITKSHQDLSSFSAPRSSPRRGSRTQSPKKRTFQLNLGDDRSPQRIRVTVETADALKRDDVNRRLFPPSSPTRSARRRETITTTTVPLNDEPGTTPPRRGRQRRTSNGTPMPRGRKRAGTPIQRTSKHPRHEDDAPSSDAAVLNDASADMGADDNDEMPKSRTKPRKTPRKTPKKTPGKTPARASVPSSQVASSTTAKRRGRSRKASASNELDVTGTEPEIDSVTNSAPTLNSSIQPSLGESLDVPSDGVSSGHIENYSAHATLKAPPRRRSGIMSSLHPKTLKEPAGIGGSGGSPTYSLQGVGHDDDPMMSEDYQGMEPRSDSQSEEGEAIHDRQDTIMEASEFSMIALDSLPSFQASFHETTDAPSSDQHEMGEETSRIINETLESLRRSLQTETEEPPPAEVTVNDSRREENGNGDREDMLNQSTATENHDNGDRGLSRSSGALNPLPLSRQVLLGRGNVDDSFSTIPDSILHAATPGRLPMKLTASEEEHHAGQVSAYGDSFSEIPNDVLEAATPKPPGRMETLLRGSSADHEERHSGPRSAVRMSNTSYGSSRLPTPDETSSSNAGSKKTHEEDTEASVEPQEHMESTNRTEVPSSPPVKTRPRALDYGPSNLQRELNGAQNSQLSSSQRQSPNKTSSNQLPALEAPHPGARPSLSPIVRVGRTLQNVISDNSSPEGRESSLRSPFRGSVSSDHPRQFSVARSPSPSIRNRGVLNKSQPSRPNMERNLRRASQASLDLQDLSGLGGSKNPRTESPRGSGGLRPYDLAAPVDKPSTTSSTSIDLATNDGGSWAANGNSSRQMSDQQASSQGATHHSQNTTGIRDTGAGEMATAPSTDIDTERDDNRHDESMPDVDGDLGGNFEEHNDNDSDDDVDVWDIEASRTSPVRPETTHIAQKSSKSSKSDLPSLRRSKVPSPWRRNSRRLIYKDDIASSSQIEIEESSQSEIEEHPPVRSSQPPISQPQQDTQLPALDPEPVQKSPIQEEKPEKENTAFPNHSDDGFEEYAGPADFEEPDEDDNDLVHQEELGASERAEDGPPDLMDEEQMERDAQDELEDFYRTAAPHAQMDASERSLVAEQTIQTQTPKAQEKAAPPKPKFFNGFDILSFFSSPATLPRLKAPESKLPAPQNQPAISQPTLETRQPREPPKGLWSTGLFPSIPPNELRPNSERRSDPFSPSSALRSSDTVADTYEASVTASPASPASTLPATSAAPSTPEHQALPPIQQKRDFTPQPGQSKDSLSGPGPHVNSSSARDSDDDRDLEESSDEEESSGLTESSEYERVPPREKPSQWDRHLSPTKSSLRSPLKPAVPGRVVAFSNNTSSPSAQPQPQPQAQAKARNMLQDSDNAHNAVSPGPLRPRFEGKENQPLPPNTTQQMMKSTFANNNSLDEPNAAITETPPAQHSPAAEPVALSQTTWTRNHWTRLDELIQLRRGDPARFAQQTRRSASALLGKEVTAQGARLVLEAWHLDVVEAFRAEVGGWDDHALAKRVFALIIGAERRRAR